MSPDRLKLGSYPTPVERATVDGASLWVKRDDVVAPDYGGNKVRKLEYLVAAAKAARKARVVTIGAVGSHHVLATALYGAREGLAVEAVLVPQPSSAHARDNLRAALALGLRPFAVSSWAAAPVAVAARLGSGAYFVPLGGSSPLGSLGFVDAAKELAAQVAAGALPEPDVVVVAMGSGGTAAGLAVGLELAQMRTRVVGVAVSQPAPLLAAMARRLARRTGVRVGLSRAEARRAADRIEADRRWVGRGYGYSTREGETAMTGAARVGIRLDPTYTAKAFACATERARGRPADAVLYWHTLSAAPMEPLLAGAGELPVEIAKLFRAPG